MLDVGGEKREKSAISRVLVDAGERRVLVCRGEHEFAFRGVVYLNNWMFDKRRVQSSDLTGLMGIGATTSSPL